MTDKELHKLRRAELLEILLYLQKELDAAKAENEELKQQIEAMYAGRKDIEEILRTVRETAALVQQRFGAENVSENKREEVKQDG